MLSILLIIVLQLAYVSLMSVRFIVMVKGIRYVAAGISAVEIGIYVIAFKIVLDNLTSPLHLVVYCLSYAGGVLLGTKLEERLAIGYITVEVIVDESYEGLAVMLRENGYGVTRWLGEGKEGKRYVHSVVTQRKKQKRLYEDVMAVAPQAFIVSYEPKWFHGGFMANRLRSK